MSVPYLPVHGVVPAVADVDGDLAKGRLEDGVPGVALHVVGGLVEVAHAGDVVLRNGQQQGNAQLL